MTGYWHWWLRGMQKTFRESNYTNFPAVVWHWESFPGPASGGGGDSEATHG